MSNARPNAKRTLHPSPDRAELAAAAERARYVGSPYHKSNPQDFGLTPPAQPRPDKTLCDELGGVNLASASALLREGLMRGAVGDRSDNGFPRLVWAVHQSGSVVEARGDNNGEYHGYPLREDDPMISLVRKRWAEAGSRDMQ